LIGRIGNEHVERRLKIEIEREAQLFGQGLIVFNLENWYSAPWIIGSALKLTDSTAARGATRIKSLSGETRSNLVNYRLTFTISRSFT
jgi:hypothetical protein